MRTKYNKQRIDLLVDMIKNEDLSIEQMCARAGIVTATFYNWKKKSYFNQVIEQANLVVNKHGIAIPRRNLKHAIRSLKKIKKQ